MEIKEKIEKMHRETCVSELKEASRLKGNETSKQLNKIFEGCQCIQIAILFNGFAKK